jgi:hypothetical protein
VPTGVSTSQPSEPPAKNKASRRRHSPSDTEPRRLSTEGVRTAARRLSRSRVDTSRARRLIAAGCFPQGVSLPIREADYMARVTLHFTVGVNQGNDRRGSYYRAHWLGMIGKSSVQNNLSRKPDRARPWRKQPSLPPSPRRNPRQCTTTTNKPPPSSSIPLQASPLQRNSRLDRQSDRRCQQPILLELSI